MPLPEQLARTHIDAMLAAAGWVVQSRHELNLGAGRGVAVREFHLKTGYADYLLIAERRALGGQSGPLNSREQIQIVSEVERRLAVVAEIEAQLQAGLKRAERLWQSILKEVVAGRLVPQDPEDEPAELLLQRIRAARAGHAGEHQPRQLQLM